MPTRMTALIGLAALLLAWAPETRAAPPAQEQKRDYLSPEESDQIRDAETPNERIKLYLTFAADRLKKFQYELQRAEPKHSRAEILNSLLNAYTGNVDDAADQITLGVEKRLEVRAGIKELQARAKEFLETLKKIQADAVELDIYKDTLDDAIEGTNDALKDAEKAAKEAGSPPVRRKP
jgi:chromosome segregation ATPase